MAVDNALYDRLGHSWWDEEASLHSLRATVNPARFAYFRDVLRRRGLEPSGLEALDVGCGGGLLAEEFARLGCRVTGLDPSERSLATAREHAASGGLDIDYRRGVGEDLPFASRSFHLVYCCDVLEHVADLDRVIGEAARVLRPGGLYLYDTINRTALSRLVVIKLLQEWPATRFLEPNLHDWNMFIKPRELRRRLEAHGLRGGELRGMQPAAMPWSLALALLQRRRGRIPASELHRRFALRAGWITQITYMGWAMKAPG